jgi:hypothetical protein
MPIRSSSSVIRNSAEGKSARWTAVRQQLAAWEKPALLAVLKDLYDANAENRDFIHARCESAQGGGEALETYRAKVVDQFFPAKGHGELDLTAARKAIRQYRKATGDVAGTAELLMTYVENGTRFTKVYGDIDERFFDSVDSALAELATILCGDGWRFYPEFSQRLANVEELSQQTGWGFHDYIQDVVRQLQLDFTGL